MIIIRTDCRGTGRVMHTVGKYGCGVHIYLNAQFYMYGGVITGNCVKAGENGGGIRVAAGNNTGSTSPVRRE